MWPRDDSVAVRSAHAEGVHTGQERAARLRPRPQRLLDAQVQFVQANPWARRLEVEAGRNLAMIDAQGRLDQAGDAGRAFQVPDVGLDGPHAQRRIRRP